jgi:hypothetical protein
MSHADATRVVHDDLPYVVVDDERGESTVYGPFDPGTEPSLAECTSDHRVTDQRVRDQVMALRPVSPEIPAHASSLAERE